MLPPPPPLESCFLAVVCQFRLWATNDKDDVAVTRVGRTTTSVVLISTAAAEKCSPCCGGAQRPTKMDEWCCSLSAATYTPIYSPSPTRSALAIFTFPLFLLLGELSAPHPFFVHSTLLEISPPPRRLHEAAAWKKYITGLGCQSIHLGKYVPTTVFNRSKFSAAPQNLATTHWSTAIH